MTNILESIDRLTSGIKSKPSWIIEAAQSLFGTLIETNGLGNDGALGPERRSKHMRVKKGSMFATLLVVGIACWAALFSSAEAAPDEQTSDPPLFDNLGSLHHPITTTSERAQRYFDQGLRFVYAFNHEEAIRSFDAATQQDPQAPMPYWGIALALGPNINSAMDKKHEHRAVEMVQKARRLADHATRGEKAYIEALVARYVSRQTSKRKALDEAYAKAMRSVVQQFPEDDDAATLFAEALMDLRPWDFWKPDGQPQPGTGEIITTLESVLARNPNHPGACHYYIHAVEASSQPERALPCAERLPGLMPGAGHLVHMPAHIYMRIGKYHQAAEQNQQAAHVDEQYLADQHPTGEYADGYYTHNLHFLWASLAMEGRNVEAMKVARDLTATITEEEARKDHGKELYLPTPIFSMIRFGRWEELLKEPPPPKGLRLMEGVWRLGRGLALVATGRIPGAEGEHVVLAGLTKQIRRHRTTEEKTEHALLTIAGRVLSGEIAARRQRYDDAIRLFEDAIKVEEALPYSEPPLWPLSVRHHLGTALLLADRPSEAESVYRADLLRHPNNGWALIGLIQSLRAQQKDDEAAEAEDRFKKAWAHADFVPATSRM
jgi:tetratricopeptide (TPR) repeat protein